MVLLNNDSGVASITFLKGPRYFPVNANSFYNISLPNIPTYPDDHIWHFDVFDNDSLKLYFKSIDKQKVYIPDEKIYRRYLLGSIIKTQRDIKKKDIKLFFSNRSLQSN